MSSSSDLYFSPQFIEELGLPSSLQFSVTHVDCVDNGDAYINAPLGEISPNHGPNQVLEHGQPSDSDPSGLSMGPPGGYFHMPGNAFNKPCDTVDSGPYSHSVYVEPNDQYTRAPYVGPSNSYSTQDFNTSHAEYVDPYRTDWELRTHLFSNSQKPLQTNHINAGPSSGNVSHYDVRQGNQELGDELDRRGRSHMHPLHHNTLARGTEATAHNIQQSRLPCPKTTHITAGTDTIVPAAPSFPNPTTSASYDSALSSPYNFSYRSQPMPHFQDPVPSSSSLLTSASAIPTPMQGPVQAPSNVTLPTAPRSSNPLPSSSSPPPYPVMPTTNAAPFTAPSNHSLSPVHQPQQKYRPILPAKKRARTAKKVVIVPAIKKDRKMEQNLPKKHKRAPVRSQEWLDRYFPSRGPCTLCGAESSVWRNDRSLEHLVSSHIIQDVKNVEHFDDDAFKNRSAPLVETEAQFAFVREQIKQIKCSLCTDVETSLVIRRINMEQHLRMKHKELTGTDVWKNELSRLKALIPEKKDWYSYNDRFLYYFPRK